MKVLVTGGAGFIGSHLVEKLVERGDQVTVLDDFSAGKTENLKNVMYNIGIVVGSICDSKLVSELASKTELIFHLATQCLVKGLEDPRLMHNVNDIGTFNVCCAAKEHHNKIVYIGTSEEYGPQQTFPIKENAPMNPVSIYGLTKLIAEQYVRFFNDVYGVPSLIIRPFNTFGPRQREDAYAGVITSFLKRIRANQKPVIFGDGTQTRDFSYVSDIVNGILLLQEHALDGEIINLGSSKEITVLEIANLLGAGPKKIAHAAPRPNDLRRLCADTSLAQQYEYKPEISFQEGLKKYATWYGSSDRI